MRKTLLTLSVTAVLAVLGISVSSAQEQEPASSLSEVLQRVKRDAREAKAENQQRLAEFQRNRNEQVAVLENARAQLNALEARSTQLRETYDLNEQRIAELEEELKNRSGQFGELFGIARQKGAEIGAIFENSIISAQYPGRAEALKKLAESRTLPTHEELDQIWEGILQEMTAQGETASFQHVVANRNDGAPVAVTRVGPFTLFASEGSPEFLKWGTDQEKGGVRLLAPITRQPSSAYIRAAKNVATSPKSELVAGPLDPSRGQLLEVLKDVPSLYERFQQGGMIGKIIVIIGIIGVLVGLWRLFVLFMVKSAVGRQKRSQAPSKGNPLGRVMAAYEGAKSSDEETLELKLDEAILQEAPKLDFGLNFLKLLAGIAPLLGLLGTVTGMIITFDQITLFGTGDPKLMAGGISQALITTVLGLITAVPIMFLHSFCTGFSRSVQATLEEQAAGMVARHAEETHRAHS